MEYKEYIGWNFREWCQLDVEDTTPIHYTIYFENGDVEYCTSNDDIPIWKIIMIGDMTIKNLDKVNGFWFIELE